MEGCKVGIAFLNDKGAEGETKGDVVECVWFLVRCVGEDCRGD